MLDQRGQLLRAAGAALVRVAAFGETSCQPSPTEVPMGGRMALAILLSVSSLSVPLITEWQGPYLWP